MLLGKTIVITGISSGIGARVGELAVALGADIIGVDVNPPARPMDAFIKAVGGKPDRASLRLKTVSWNGQTDVITLKLDKHYWPAFELERQKDGGWIRTALDPVEVTARTGP